MKKVFIIVIIIIIAGLIYIGMHFSNNQTSTASVNASSAKDNTSQNINASNTNVATTPVSNSNNDNTNNTNNTTNTSNTSNNNSTINKSNNTTNSTTQDNNQFTMNLGNGNFTQLLESTSFLYGQVENGAIMIINLGSIVNNQIIGTEYYLGEPSEQFTVKISSLGSNKYIIYEFYHGKHTGTFKVSSSPNYGMQYLTGTYTKAGTNQESNVTLSSNNISSRHIFQMHGLMDNYPYYTFNLDGTNTNWVNLNNGDFFEFYSGDSNAFIIQPDTNYTGQNYEMVYTETYKGTKTGEYYLNYNSKTNEHYGKYVKYVNGQPGQSYNIVLKGSKVPTYSL